MNTLTGVIDGMLLGLNELEGGGVGAGVTGLDVIGLSVVGAVVVGSGVGDGVGECGALVGTGTVTGLSMSTGAYTGAATGLSVCTGAVTGEPVGSVGDKCGAATGAVG